MPKRKFSEVAPEAVEQPKKPEFVKNSLDSDEEDDDSEEDERYQLKDEDIEGQEEGNVGLEEGVQITPFNMKEELEEGHFDNDGMYHWKKEKLVKDSWLENIDWIKVKETESKTKNVSLGSDDEMSDIVNINELYKEILGYMLPKETIAKSLKRLGGQKSLSASERLKLKKAGLLPQPVTNNDVDKVTKLTELANKILTHSGNMDIYQETFEYIEDKLNASSSKRKPAQPDLDMYSDDFGEKEKERLVDTSDNNTEDQSRREGNKVMWEYKKTEDGNVEGPYSSQQMDKWSQSGHFGNGVLVRKCGTDQFYTSNRIDFDLYV